MYAITYIRRDRVRCPVKIGSKFIAAVSRTSTLAVTAARSRRPRGCSAHRPHPAPETGRGAVRAIPAFLEAAGVKP